MHERAVTRCGPGLRVERQAKAHRRVTRHQIAALRTQKPGPAAPARTRPVVARDRQHVAHRVVESLLEHLAQTLALQGIVEPCIERIHVGRQPALAPQVVPGVLVGREHVGRIQCQSRGNAAQKACGLPFGRAMVGRLVGKQRRVAPERFAVATPVQIQRPAWELFARIPLALPEVHEPLRRIVAFQARQQFGGTQPLGGADRIRVPFSAVPVVDRHERRLAALRETDVVRAQILVDAASQCVDLLPLCIAVRQGHARRLPDAADLHRVCERAVGALDHARHRRSRRGFGRARQRNVSLARQQPRGRIQPDPAGARQEHLAPRVQVGEIGFGSCGTIERFHVRRELDQIAGDEARSQPEMAQQLHQQPARVAAGPRAADQCLLRCLDAGLHADQIADVALQPLVQRHQEIDRACALARHLRKIGGEPRRRRQSLHERRQFHHLPGVVDEGHLFGLRLQEEVERVQDRHLGDQVDLDAERVGLFGKHQAGEIVGLRILLPVDEVADRFHPHRIREHARTRVRAGAQTNDLWPERDRAVVAIVRDVVQRDMDGHDGLRKA